MPDTNQHVKKVTSHGFKDTNVGTEGWKQPCDFTPPSGTCFRSCCIGQQPQYKFKRNTLKFNRGPRRKHL